MNAVKSLLEIADGASQDIASLNSAIPSQAASIDGILSSAGEGEAISQVIGEAKAVEQKIEATSDLSGAPADLVAAETKCTRNKFVDHLAGQEDKIMDEIKSMEKLQQKYHSVTDVRYLPKRRTNPEKGKPFVERLILGSGFQADNRAAQWIRIDLAPYAGYKFSDRFRACLGGTYRVSVDMHHLEFSRKDKTFGYRAFGDYRILNGLFAHLEIEALKTNIPSWHLHKAGLKDTGDPTWVPMAYVGITKSYKLGRRIRGNTQMLYNFLAVSRNFDFNKVTFRFALEFELRKRKVPHGG